MNRLIKLLLSLVFPVGLILCLFSCGKNEELMQKATGKPGDIVMLIDSNQWNHALGDTLRAILEAEVGGLPREEVLFNVMDVHPSSKISFLKQAKNLIFVFTLDQKTSGARYLIDNFTDETINRIRTDTSFYIYTTDNVYSRGQTVIYLFSNTEENLIHQLHKNKQQLVDYINKLERERYEESVLKSSSNKAISKFLQDDPGCSITLPIGYELADKQDNFVWFRQMLKDADKDIFISWRTYNSEYQLLPDSLIAWRDEIALKHLFEDPADTSTFMVTEREVPWIPVTAKQTSINDRFAMELKGIWRTNNKSMGGPFVSYSLVDEKRGLQYYIEGFVYSPAKAQRETIRELETILRNFSILEKSEDSEN